MLFRSLLVAMALVSTAIPGRFALAQTTALASTSPWAADYRDDSCRLVRMFGTGDNTVILTLSRYSPMNSFQLSIAGEPFKGLLSKGKADVQFGEAEAIQHLNFVVGSLGDRPALLFVGMVGIEPGDVESVEGYDYRKAEPLPAPYPTERLAAITTLTISKASKMPIVLKTGPMDKPFAALSSCINDLVKSWGIDPEKDRTRKRPPVPKNSPGSWVTAGDYPKAMVLAEQSAIVQFRVMVNEKGVPTSCHIQESTRPKEFDDAVCKNVMKRAKFDPAIDAEGKPMASYWRNSVRFQAY